MPTPTIPSVFSQLGYEVFGQRYGVYHLRRPAAEGRPYFEGVGLLHIEQPAHNAEEVMLFVVNACSPETGKMREGLSVAQLQDAWGNIDARRLLESGLEVIRLPRDQATFGRFVGESTILRPGEAVLDRKRYLLEMESGDVVCLN